MVSVAMAPETKPAAEVTPRWASLADFAARIAEGGERPALVFADGERTETWRCDRLAEAAAGLARGLVAAGLGEGEPVALFAPNRAEWVVALLAILRAGGVAVPIDEQAPAEDIAHIVAITECRRAFTVASHRETLTAAAPAIAPILLDDGEPSWRDLIAETGQLPEPGLDAIAAILFTSGTTGVPKGVPLSHRNILCDLEGLLAERLVDARDRVVLPLPLHHAYPLSVGLLGTLASDATLVLTAGVTGPPLVAALKATRATTMVGVPRLYAALAAGIEARAEAAGMGRRFRLLRALSLGLRRRGIRLGRILFRRLHAAIGPELGLLGCGGARLDETLWWSLEALGYRVLTGYGLTETAPILTFNSREHARIGSAGRPIPGVSLRIADPGADGNGEVQATGPTVFAGYWRDPEATARAFTADGWFRTGDLGHQDADGFLFLVGRAKELIVLSGGENIQPEDVERAYTQAPCIKEVAVLERDDRLVALVVPDEDTIRRVGAARIDAMIREAIEERSAALPSYQRVAGYVVVREPLPRTRIGKLRRHLLPAIYDQARAGRARHPAAAAGPPPQAASARAREVWRWLEARFADHALAWETSPQLDLGIDSLEWLTLTLDIEHRFGVRLDEDAIAGIMTLGDLVRAIEAAEPGTRKVAISEEQRRWLEPPPGALRLLGAIVFALDWLAAQLLFRLRVEGRAQVPREGPLVIAPNHSSYLDSPVLAAALGWRRLRRTYWAGWTGIMFAHPVMRFLSRIARVLPVDPDRHPAAALALAAEALGRGQILIWFPEGRISLTGEINPLAPGVGYLVATSGAPVLPVWLSGTREALPRGRQMIRPGRIVVRFGAPITAAELARRGVGKDEPARIVAGLEAALRALGEGG